MAELIVTGYSFPSTSDKKDDETWVAYWDRKRHEAHEDSRSCLLCSDEERLEPDAGGWQDFLAVDQEEIDPGGDHLPTRPAT